MIAPAVLGLVGAALLAGCAPTLGEIRGMPPYRVVQAPGDYAQLAACTTDRLQTGPRGRWYAGPGDFTWQLVQLPAATRATVTAVLHAPFYPPFYHWDLTFRPAGSTATVDVRAMHGQPDDAPPSAVGEASASMWAAIRGALEVCAGAPLVITAP